MIVSDKMQGFYHGGSAIRKMFEEGLRLKALHGADRVADLSLGNPAFPPPAAFTDALQRLAAAGGPHAYMPNAGYPAVRARVAEHLNRRGFFDHLTADDVVMTSGAAGALNVALKTILEEGDEVIVPSPYFVEYRYYIDNAGGRMVLVDTADDFDLDVDRIAAAITPRTRALIVNSPNNPSGRMYPRATLDALADMLWDKSEAVQRPILLLSDEPYREVLFDGRTFVSPASVYEDSILCYSWSKAFCVSGERIGYLAVNPRLETPDRGLLMGALAMANRILGFVNAPAFMQRVVAEALDAPVDVRPYAAKRERLCAALDAGGYDYVRPEGTFYVFARTLGPEAAFVETAKEHLLLVVPGRAFGREGYFRLSYACDDATVDLACRKLIEIAEELRDTPPVTDAREPVAV